MLSTSRILLLQCQLLLLEKGIKEYSADWLENTNTVMRDTGGKFATKARTSIEETKSAAKSLTQGAEITSDTIQSLVKDKAFRERAGLAAGLAAANVVKSVAAKIKANPKVETKIDQYIAEIQQQLSEIYGDDKSPFGQALRKTDDLQLPFDATFAEKLEFQVARYKALDEVIKNPEYAHQKKEKKQESLGNLVKYGVPIATSFAVALAPELLLPLVLEGTIDLGAALTSAALGASVDVGTNAVLDKAGVENPVIRIVAGLLSGAAAAGIVSGGKAILGKRTVALAEQETIKKADRIGTIPENIPSKKILKGKQRELPKNITKESGRVKNLEWNTWFFLEDGGKLIRLSTVEIPIKLPFVNTSVTNVAFEVDESLNKTDVLSPNSAKKSALKLKSIFEHITTNSEEGKIFSCSPHAKDGDKDYRTRAYKNFGFSEPQNGKMIGIIKDGRLVPYYPPFGNILSMLIENASNA